MSSPATPRARARARASLPSLEHSRVVLVGTARYDHLAPLPPVANNIDGIRAALTDPQLWGLPDRHCAVLADPSDPAAVLDAIHRAATEATDALIVFMSGHGLLVGESSELFLALKGSDKERPYTAVRYDDVRREVVRTAQKCHSKVVILDCCYAGRAMAGHMTDNIKLADIAGIDGTYVMTATSETATAWSPPGAQYTAFSGALINRLVNGVPGGPGLLDTQTLYYNVRQDLVELGFPVPQQRARNDGALIVLVRNRAASEPTPSRPRAPEPPPPRLTATIQQPPSVIVDEARRQRDRGADGAATELLTAVGYARDPQGVVAVVQRLRAVGDDLAAQTVTDGVITRRPADVIEVADIFRALDRPESAADVLAATAERSIGAAAALAQALAGLGRTDDLRMVLDRSLASAQRQETVLDLVGALWALGLRDEVDGMLERGASTMSAPYTLRIADELRSAGRDLAAFGLYRVAAAAVAGRGPAAVAALIRDMEKAGREPDARQLAEAAVAASRTAVEAARLVTALRHTQQGEIIDRALARAARMPSDSDILDAAGHLVSAGDDPAALTLCQAAVAGRAAAEVLPFVESLRDRGRPVDALKVLDAAATTLAMAETVDLAALADESDRTRIIQAAVGQADFALGEFAALAVLAGHAAVVEGLCRLLRAQSADRLAVALTALCDVLDEAQRQAVFDMLVQHLTRAERGSLEAAVSAVGAETLAAVIPAMCRALPEADARSIMAAVLPTLEPTVLEPLLVSLASSAADGPPALRHVAADAVDRLVQTRDGQPDTVLEPLIWLSGPVARRAEWWMAAGLDADTEQRLGELEWPGDRTATATAYEWLWFPFSRSRSLRAIMGRIGYLIDSTRPDEIPAFVASVDVRVALGLVLCRWRFTDDESRTAAPPPAGLAAGLLPRYQALEVLRHYPGRPPYPQLLTALPAAVLTEIVRRLRSGWAPGRNADQAWRAMMGKLDRSFLTPAANVVNAVAEVIVGVIAVLGVGVVAGTLFGFWPRMSMELAIVFVVALAVAVGGIGYIVATQNNDDNAENADNAVGVVAVACLVLVVVVGGEGLATTAGWIGWRGTIEALTLLAFAVTAINVLDQYGRSRAVSRYRAIALAAQRIRHAPVPDAARPRRRRPQR